MHESFFCVFMDCQMPGTHARLTLYAAENGSLIVFAVLDGFAATAKIRELENNGTINGRLHIIALTANVSIESEEKCKAAGMDHFLPKPFKMAGAFFRCSAPEVC